MTKPDYEQGGELQTLPPELLPVVDGLTAGSVSGTSDARIAEFRLSYGVAGKDEVLDTARLRAADASMAYRAEISSFVRMGQPVFGIPKYATIEAEGQNYPPHEGTIRLVSPWLATLGKHDPTAANQVVTEIADTVVNGYDQSAYDAMVEALPNRYHEHKADRIQHKLRDGAHRLADSTASYISGYTTDPAVARRFMQSDFFSAFGNDELRLSLQHHIVNLEGHETPDGYTADYQELLQRVESTLENRYIPPSALVAFYTIAERTPALTCEIAGRHPATTTDLRVRTAKHLLDLDEATFTPEHAATVDHIEASLSGNVRAYAAILGARKKRDGSISLDKIVHLADLLRDNPDVDHEHPLGKEASLVALHVPDENLAQLLAGRPYLTVDDSAKSIAIRRLARLGAVDQALGLVDQKSTTIDTASLALTPVRNLLAIYEESGDEKALNRANARVEQLMNKSPGSLARPFETDLHELAARRYLGARRHSNESLADEAAAEMATYHDIESTWMREEVLKRTLQMLIDTGEIEAAEGYAERLYWDDKIAAQNENRTGYTAILAVVNAYAKVNRPDDAVRFIQGNILLEQPLNYHALWAVENIVTGGKSFRPSLYARRLDPTLSTEE